MHSSRGRQRKKHDNTCVQPHSILVARSVSRSEFLSNPDAMNAYWKEWESFEKKQFLHRCDGETFIPLMPPQTMQDEDRKQLAYSAYSKVKTDLLPRIDLALWQAFSAIEGIVEVLDSIRFDVTERFF